MTSAWNLEQYQQRMSLRLKDAHIVPMADDLDEWKIELDLQIGQCALNTQKWTKRFPHYVRVPGWIRNGGDHFCFHWVVRSPEGRLFDVTPIEHHRNNASGEIFVEHSGDIKEFERAISESRCQFGLILSSEAA
jgi:hypothetical protein